MIIQVTPLWQDGKLILNGCPIGINCADYDLSSMRWAWLVPKGCCGTQYEVSFVAPAAEIQAVLQGAWITTHSGNGMVLNVNSIQDVIDACDGCCGSNSVVAVHYGPQYQLPDIVDVSPQEYCFEREDAGTSTAFQSAALAYYGQYEINSFKRKTRAGTLTTYCFMSTSAPAFIQGDEPLNGPLYQYKTAPAPPLGENQLYTFVLTMEGAQVGDTLHATSLQALLSILNTDPEYSAGTWGLSGSSITLLSSLDDVTIEIGTEDISGNIVYSNVAPPNGSGQLYRLASSVSGIQLLPDIYGASLQALIQGMNGFPAYQGQGTWFVDGDDRIALAMSAPGSATLTLTGGNSSGPRSFDSNNAPALQSGNTYNITVNKDGTVLSPILLGDTLAQLVSKLQTTAPYNTLGTWVAVNNTYIELQIQNSNNVMNALLTIGQEVKPPLVLDSNAAPSLSAGQHLDFAVTLDAVPYTPHIGGATVNNILTSLQDNAIYNAMGAWSIQGGNAIRLTSTTHDAGQLVLTATNIFTSNSAPSLQSGNIYALTVYASDVSLAPLVLGQTLAIIVAQIPGFSAYTAIGGTWAVAGSTIQLTGGNQPNLYIVIDQQVEEAPLPLESNDAPALGGGEHYVMTVTLDMVELVPPITGATLAELVTNAEANSLYAAKGTWSVDGSKVKLVTTVASGGQIEITTAANAMLMGMQQEGTEVSSSKTAKAKNTGSPDAGADKKKKKK